ncbi:MAG: hypothetical protein AB7P31_14630 [Steroidobacteraceae bacterium]
MEPTPAARPSLALMALWAAAGGAALWALSPLFLGLQEPWDAGLPYYTPGLVAIGAGLAWHSRRRVAIWPILAGLGLGQAAYVFLVLGGGNLWPLTLVALAVYLIPAYVAARIVYWWIGRSDAGR